MQYREQRAEIRDVKSSTFRYSWSYLLLAESITSWSTQTKMAAQLDPWTFAPACTMAVPKELPMNVQFLFWGCQMPPTIISSVVLRTEAEDVMLHYVQCVEKNTLSSHVKILSMPGACDSWGHIEHAQCIRGERAWFWNDGCGDNPKQNIVRRVHWDDVK